VDRLLVYATGANANLADQQAIDAIVDSTHHDQFGLRALTHAVIQSPLFRER
jgi:hypothetical protein